MALSLPALVLLERTSLLARRHLYPQTTKNSDSALALTAVEMFLRHSRARKTASSTKSSLRQIRKGRNSSRSVCGHLVSLKLETSLPLDTGRRVPSELHTAKRTCPSLAKESLPILSSIHTLSPPV